MKTWQKVAFKPLWFLALILLPLHAGAQTFFSDTPIAGDSVPVTVTVADASGGVDVTVSIPAGSGDLLGFFANVSDESALGSVRVLNPTGVVTGSAIAANTVTQVGGGNNVRPTRNWDIGLRLGRAGSAGGAITQASFGFSGLTAVQLTTALNDGWLFGVRIQSTLGAEGSAKIGVVNPVTLLPSVQIASPLEGEVVTDPVAIVSGVAQNAQSVTVHLQGEGVPVTAVLNADGTFLAPLPLQPGLNTIVATAINGDGTATDRVDVILQPAPLAPTIAIGSPQEGDLLADALVTVSGTTTNAQSVTVELLNAPGPVPAVLHADGTFSATLALQPGPNTIVASAFNQGLTATATVNVSFQPAPTVEIASPQEGDVLTDSVAIVSGVARNAETVTVQLQGSSTPVTATLDEDGTFLAPIALQPGPNTIVVTAQSGELSATDTVSVVFQPAPLAPTIEIAEPLDGAELTTPQLEVSGATSDAQSVTVELLGGTGPVQAVLNADGRFSAPALTLQPGSNTIVATAFNGTLTATDTVTVILRAPPAITIGFPQPDAVLTEALVVVTGVVTNAESVTVGLLGSEPVPAALGPGGTFSASLTLQPGPNTIVASALNGPLSATDQVSVTLQLGPVLPTVAITSPLDGARFEEPAAAAVSGITTNAVSVLVEFLESGEIALVTPDDNGGFTTEELALATGPNTIRATATNAEGSAVATITVTVTSGGGRRIR